MAASPLATNWRLGDRPDLRSIKIVNGLFRAHDMRGPSALPCFDNTTTLMIGSDYGGQHSTSRFEALALITPGRRQRKVRPLGRHNDCGGSSSR